MAEKERNLPTWQVLQWGISSTMLNKIPNFYLLPKNQDAVCKADIDSKAEINCFANTIPKTKTKQQNCFANMSCNFRLLPLQLWTNSHLANRMSFTKTAIASRSYRLRLQPDIDILVRSPTSGNQFSSSPIILTLKRTLLPILSCYVWNTSDP